jgi:hypothetical protein
VPLVAPPAATAPVVAVVVVLLFTVPGAGRAVTVRARAAAVAPARAVHVAEELAPQVPAHLLDVHEVAVAAAVADVLLELAAGGLAEVGDGRELGDDGAARVEPALQRPQRRGGLLLLAELRVHVADHVVGEVVADVQAVDVAVPAELLEDVLVEVVEVGLDARGVDGPPLRVHAGRDHVRALVHVAQQQRRRDGRLGVQSRAPVAVPARADLEVEGAVHAVLLCAEDGRQVLGHGPRRSILAPPLLARPARLVGRRRNRHPADFCGFNASVSQEVYIRGNDLVKESEKDKDLIHSSLV